MEDPLEKEIATHSQYSCLGNPMDRGAWQATFPRGCKLVGHDLAIKQQLAVYFIRGSVLCQCYCLNSSPPPPLAVSTNPFSSLPLCSCSANRLIGIIFQELGPGGSSWDLAEGFWLIKGKDGSPRGAGTQPACPCTRLHPKQDRT